MTRLGVGVGIGLLPRSGILLAPVVANQTLDFGALTLTGAKIDQVAYTGAAPTDIIKTGGTASANFNLSSSGVVTAATGAPGAGTVTFSYNGGTETGTITMVSQADEYSVGVDADITAVIALQDAISGKSVSIAPGSYGSLGIWAAAWPARWTTETIWKARTASKRPVFTGGVLDEVDFFTGQDLAFNDQVTTNNSTGMFRFRKDVNNPKLERCLLQGINYPLDAYLGSSQGIRWDTVGLPPSNVSIIDCSVYDTAQAIVLDPVRGNVLITGHHIKSHFTDAIHINRVEDPVGTTTEVSFGTYERVTNEGGGHADAIQVRGTGLPAATKFPGLIITDNLFLYDTTKQIQAALCEARDDSQFDEPQIHRNVGLITTAHGASFGAVVGGSYTENTFVHPDTSIGTATQPGIHIGLNDTVNSVTGTPIVTGNICEQIAIYRGTAVDEGNVRLGLRGGLISYASVFDGDFSVVHTSRADAITRCAMKANGPADIDDSGGPTIGDAGGLGTGAFTPPTATPGRTGALKDTAYETYYIPPALTVPVDLADGATAGTGSVDTDTNTGTLYRVLLATGATVPLAEQVVAGTDGDDTAAVVAGSQAVSATGTQAVAFSPLIAATGYFACYVHVSVAGVPSNVSVADGFTTASSFTPQWVVKDANDYLSSAALTGFTDSKTGIIHMTFEVDAVAGIINYLFENELLGSCVTTLSGRFFLSLETEGGVPELSISSPGVVVAINTKYNLLICVDTTGTSRVYLNETEIASGTASSGNINWNNASAIAFGARFNGTLPFAGEEERIRTWFGQNIDPTVPANRRKFYAADGTPADPADTFATLGAPDIEVIGNAAVWNGDPDQLTSNGSYVDA